jgi:hypothetical protein
MKPSAHGMYLEMFCGVIPDPMTTGTLASSFTLQFFQLGRFSGSRSCHNDAVDKKELRLIYHVHNIEVGNQRERTVLLVNVTEYLDIVATEFCAFSQEPARAAFDEAGATDMRENIALHSKKIQIGFASDLQAGLICSFEHLDADWTSEALSRLFCDAFHKSNALRIERRLDIGNIVTVLEHDHVCASL